MFVHEIRGLFYNELSKEEIRGFSLTSPELFLLYILSATRSCIQAHKLNTYSRKGWKLLKEDSLISNFENSLRKSPPISWTNIN